MQRTGRGRWGAGLALPASGLAACGLRGLAADRFDLQLLPVQRRLVLEGPPDEDALTGPPAGVARTGGG